MLRTGVNPRVTL